MKYKNLLTFNHWSVSRLTMMQIGSIRYSPHETFPPSNSPECPYRAGPEVEYKWRIENFSMCPQAKGQSLESPSFTADSLNQSEFKLVLYPRGREEDDVDNVTCFLECLTEPDYKISVVITVLGSNKSAILTKTKECLILDGGRRIGFVFLSDRHESVVRNVDFLSDDVLIIRCVLTPEYRAPFVCDDLLAISRDYRKLLENGDFSDFVICGTEGEKYKVHKIILAIRTPHFARRLGLLDDKDIIQGNIDDMKPSVLRALLDYLYSGNLMDNLTPDVLSEVYEIAKLYNMDNLERDIFPPETATIACTYIKVDRRTISWDLRGFHPYGLRYGDKDWPITTFVDLTHGRFVVSFSAEMGNDNKPFVQIDFYSQSLTVDGGVLVRCNVLLNLRGSGPKPEFCSGEHFFDANKVETHSFSMTGDLDILNSWISQMQYPDIVTLVFRIALSSTGSNSECRRVEVKSSLVAPNPARNHRSYQSLSSNLDMVFRRTIGENFPPCDTNRDHLERFCDLLIRSVSGKLISVHSCILAARSGKFRKLLKHNDNSIKPATLDLTDLSDETLEDLLRYVYSGNVIEMHLRRVTLLYLAAIKYEVHALVKTCTYLLKTRMTLSDVCILLQLAEDNKDDNLLSVLQCCIRKNKTIVLGSDIWESIVSGKPQLASKMLSALR